MNPFEGSVLNLCEPFKVSTFNDLEGFFNITFDKGVLVLVTLDQVKKLNVSSVYFFERKQKNTNHYFVWEDWWLSTPEIIESRIRSLLGKTISINARDTHVVTIDTLRAKKFVNQNHLNVFTKCKFRYALVYRYQIVAVATFSKSCPVHRDDVVYKSHELIRYCSLLNTTIVGGFTKLINAFTRDNKPDDIMTYVDLDLATGEGYTKLGFKVLETRELNTFLLNLKEMKRYYPHKVSDVESLSFPNEEWLKIYNSGGKKMLMDLKG